MRNTNYNQTSRNTFHFQKINLDAIYRQMSCALHQRALLQSQLEDQWRSVRATHCNRHEEINKISKKIGENTYLMDGLVGQLCQYRKSHQAMNLAADYLRKEIERTQKIVAKWERGLAQVNTGKAVLLSSDGNIHIDTASTQNYVAGRRLRIQSLQKRLAYVNQYLA
jgi:predicted transcriptional regulator